MLQVVFCAHLKFNRALLSERRRREASGVDAFQWPSSLAPKSVNVFANALECMHGGCVGHWLYATDKELASKPVGPVCYTPFSDRRCADRRCGSILEDCSVEPDILGVACVAP